MTRTIGINYIERPRQTSDENKSERVDRKIGAVHMTGRIKVNGAKLLFWGRDFEF